MQNVNLVGVALETDKNIYIVYTYEKGVTMSGQFSKKLFPHGGSKAIDLPASFVRRLKGDHVVIEEREDGLFIPAGDTLDTIESSPLFDSFVQAILHNALQNPERLQDAHEVWDQEWAQLLDGVDDSE